MGLFQGHKRNGATIIGAREILDRVSEAEVLQAVRSATPEPDKAWLARSNVTVARRKMQSFCERVDAVNLMDLKQHRDWVWAHSTTNDPPAVMYGEIWASAENALAAADELCFFALCEASNLVGMAQAHRESAVAFWELVVRGSQVGGE